MQSVKKGLRIGMALLGIAILSGITTGCNKSSSNSTSSGGGTSTQSTVVLKGASQ